MKLLELLKLLGELEIKTDYGKINYRGMVFSLFAVLVLTGSPIFESIVRIFKDNYTTGVPVLQLVIVFMTFNLACVLLVGMLERGARR